jgi:hypothetical protein
MRWFSTAYQSKQNEFSSFIFAENEKVAKNYVEMRNIGERIIGVLQVSKDFDPCPLPSLHYQARKLPDCAHVLTFYTWIAMRGGFADAEILADDGILHEVIHELHLPDHHYRETVFSDLKKFETFIPGLKTYKTGQN